MSGVDAVFFTAPLPVCALLFSARGAVDDAHFKFTVDEVSRVAQVRFAARSPSR